MFISISLTGKHQQPDEQSGLSGISFSIWQPRLITTFLYNMMNVATHRCWLSLFLSRRGGESAGMPGKHHCICWTGDYRERRGQPFREWTGVTRSGCTRVEKRDRTPHDCIPSRLYLNIHLSDTVFLLTHKRPSAVLISTLTPFLNWARERCITAADNSCFMCCDSCTIWRIKLFIFCMKCHHFVIRHTTHGPI